MSDAAIVTIVSGVITLATMILGFLTMWVKLRYGQKEIAEKTDSVGEKIDQNTQITQAGTAAAVENAKKATETAISAKIAAQHVAEQLNGKLEDKITSIVKAHIEPVMIYIKAHSEQDDRNMLEIRQALGELRDQVKAR